MTRRKGRHREDVMRSTTRVSIAADARDRTSAATREPAPPHPVSSAARWRWRTFPVFCAFVAGLLIASLLNRETDSNAEALVQYAAVLGTGYAIAHLLVTNVVTAGRLRRRENADADPEWEETIIHPDD